VREADPDLGLLLLAKLLSQPSLQQLKTAIFQVPFGAASLQL
jgi:hypothetical protein